MHFLRDLRGHVHEDQRDALGTITRSIFTAPDEQEARRRLAGAIAGPCPEQSIKNKINRR